MKRKIKHFKSLAFLISLFVIMIVSSNFAKEVQFNKQEEIGNQVFILSNEYVKLSIVITEGILERDVLAALDDWLSEYKTPPFNIYTDANYELEIIWTNTRAPEQDNNTENPIVLSKKDFLYDQHEVMSLPKGSKELDLLFKHHDSRNISLELRITYRLEPGEYYAKRKVYIRDLSNKNYFLQVVRPLKSSIKGKCSIIKPGGFGQPIAVRIGKGGAFFGLEDPTSENAINIIEKRKAVVQCSQEIGERIGKSWIGSEWVVTGITPNSLVKLWFNKYLDRIRLAFLKPHLSYNSLYDVQAPKDVKDQPKAKTETNVLRIIESFHKKMNEEHELRINTFILDDGSDIYNITSNTWLSPWWLKFANTIWMQVSDHDFTTVPSISRIDQAITYRDSIIYDGQVNQDVWFPIENLIAQGIIKGHLQMLRDLTESIDKFSDNAFLYFARGPSMRETYISNDLLTEYEKDALNESVKWAKDRFELLTSTEMIGGDPDKREAYGYVHFKGKKGILACRNPFIEQQTLELELSPSFGLDPEADSLVIDRIYPTRKILPNLYKAGKKIGISLQGYETAIYEIYPIEEALDLLIAGVRYDVLGGEIGKKRVILYDGDKSARLLNPEKVRSVTFKDQSFDSKKFSLPFNKLYAPVRDRTLHTFAEQGKSRTEIKFDLEETTRDAYLAILLESDEGMENEKNPKVEITYEGKKVEPRIETQKGNWGWYSVDVQYGKRAAQMLVYPPENRQEWKGSASVWIVCLVESKASEVFFDLVDKNTPSPYIPSSPWPPGFTKKNVKIAEVDIIAKK